MYMIIRFCEHPQKQFVGFYLSYTVNYVSVSGYVTKWRIITLYNDAGKSLARAGRKQANVPVRMERISFGALPRKEKKNLMTARVSMLLKSSESLICYKIEDPNFVHPIVLENK